MKRLYLVPILLLLAVGAIGAVIEVPTAPAFMSLPIVGGGVEEAAAVCSENETYSYDKTTNNYTNIGYESDHFYNGTTFTQTDGDIDVCAISLRLVNIAGDPSNNDYYVSIFANDWNESLAGAAEGTSDARGDLNLPSEEWVKFDFSSSVTLSSGTTYSIVVHTTEVDTTDVLRLRIETTDHSYTYGLYSQWKQNKTPDNATSAYDVPIKIWTE